MLTQAETEFQADQSGTIRGHEASRYAVRIELLAAFVATSLVVGIAVGAARGDMTFLVSWAKWCGAYWAIGFALAQPLERLWAWYDADVTGPSAAEVVNLQTAAIIAWPVAALVTLAFVPLVLLLRRLFANE
jgi:hypothetical protein